MKIKALKNLFDIKKVFVTLMAVVLAAGIFVQPLQVKAAVTNSTPAPKVSFTFDDGFNSAITQAAPTLSKYGLTGTDYVTTGCIGMTTVPNTCRADKDKAYMTWAQVKQLRDQYGWEIGSHTVTHPYLAEPDTDDQPLPLTEAQMKQEVSQSKAALAAQGIDAKAFASPYGDYNPAVLAEVAKHYTSHRGFADVGYNSWPNSDYYLRVQQVQAGVSVSTVKSYIDTAIQSKQWLILVFHDIKTRASRNPDDYEYNTADLDQVAAYVKSKAAQIQSVNVSNGLVASDTNLLPNSTFNDGIAGGWTTDSPTTITKDTATNGSAPDAVNSVKMVSSTKNGHLFSPQVSVSSTNSYVLKNFLNVKTLTTGEVGFYIDEYNSNGAWISGQYKAAERSVFAEQVNFSYIPSSAAVAKASLQIFVAGTGITAYVDNTQWFSTTNNPLPPVATNLMPNHNFDAGIAGGWTTDSATSIIKDSGNNGGPADPVNSAKLTATIRNTHLFSPQVTVDATKTYNLSTYLNIKTRLSGEIGYYIDEYDANGNWISGQYKTGISNLGVTASNLTYKPTSTNVKKASLQVIITSNSGITAYFDSVFFGLPL